MSLLRKLPPLARSFAEKRVLVCYAFWEREASYKADKKKKILGKIELGAPINSTVTAANGAIYFATMTQLFAVQKK